MSLLEIENYFINSKNSCSFKIFTPNFSALSSLEPGLSPTTT